ncbi:hypothetical protein RF11_11406 [Thelohanellus kitauei]|uniref:Uncharacterized protein n=1 Tax=Thelohanellus kitauei TaxID=669202 RepID=A0A0C2J3K3_THEKT|nr:hypothetical protein RF11_11406 [Thelohanellus kitauei]
MEETIYSQLQISTLRLSAHSALLHKFRSRFLLPKDRKMIPLKFTNRLSAHTHSVLLSCIYVYLFRKSAHRFNGYPNLHIGNLIAPYRDHTQQPRAVLPVCLFLSESPSNKTLALSEQTEVARHHGVHRSQISRILRNKEHILQNLQINTIPDGKRKQWPLLMEKAKQLPHDLIVKDFYSTNGSLERRKERDNIKFKKLNGEKQDPYYFDAESWIRDAPPAITKDYDAKDILH